MSKSNKKQAPTPATEALTPSYVAATNPNAVRADLIAADKRKYRIHIKRQSETLPTNPSVVRHNRQFWATINGGNGEIMFTGELRGTKQSLIADVTDFVAGIQSGNFEVVNDA